MRHLRPFAAVALSAALVAAPGIATASPVLTGSTTAVAASAASDPAALKARIARLMPKTDSATKRQLDRLIRDPHRIDGSQYQCGPTEFAAWQRQSTADWTDEDFQILDALGAFDLPTYEALVYGSENDPAFALRSDAQVLQKTFRKLKKFWDIKSDDIQLMAMHGDMMRDPARTSRVYQTVFGVPKAEADELASLLAEFIAQPKFQGGNHPLFTLNAFAFSSYGEDVDGLGVIGDRIVMGDGILRAYREMGYGDVAPQAILAHEFGHHVQFELRMHGDVASPEATRRTELHADAAAAYFLSHPRGMSMQIKRVTQFLRVFYSIGDCGFDSNGHHGTPNQRERAGNWAYQLQESARPKGKVLSAAEFTRRFEAVLPQLVAPDAA
ncbi:hypothetical protein [Mobilicoccus pelagius]|uniref:Metalloprotease n=1 Tax=Mobilicoccus pelagius NBRC 104925 TaxID=1089455 RepID=H5UPN8_9MICO|nr:hypothetical protein [Mobilicoccus pelagius]GAB47696.1 hypothetical protein MOPEL_027_00070 [Mobilicoccus pelagius NBRC 104925]